MEVGTVIAGTPAQHGRFPVPKRRTLIVTGPRMAIPTSASQAARRTFEPDSSNGLWKPCDLIPGIRCLIRDRSEIDVLGRLSPAALLILQQKLRVFNPSLILDLI